MLIVTSKFKDLITKVKCPAIPTKPSLPRNAKLMRNFLLSENATGKILKKLIGST